LSKDELREVTIASRRALEAELAALSEEQMLLPGVVDDWTMKDVLAHISAWERMFMSWIESLMRDETPDRPEFFSQEWTDRVNASVYEENRDRPLADILRESQASHEAVLAFIERMTDAELFDQQHFPWAKGRAMAPWLRANADEHYDEHREQIIAWRAKLKE
jgi:hypothetical protein